MTRREKVFSVLKELSESIDMRHFETGRVGVDADTICSKTGLDRSNVSRELNRLVQESFAVKIIGRPILFINKKIIEEKIGKKLNVNVIDDIRILFNMPVEHKGLKENDVDDPFSNAHRGGRKP